MDCERNEELLKELKICIGRVFLNIKPAGLNMLVEWRSKKTKQWIKKPRLTFKETFGRMRSEQAKRWHKSTAVWWWWW
jgi:hypothetical protein